MSKFNRIPFIAFFSGLFFVTLLTAPLTGSGQLFYEKERQTSEEIRPIRLNNKNFQKNLEKYGHELELTPKQIKKLNRIERKYTRREARMARKPSTKKRHLRGLQKTKREQMIAVLSYEQQQKLQRLSRSGFWDFMKAR